MLVTWHYQLIPSLCSWERSCCSKWCVHTHSWDQSSTSFPSDDPKPLKEKVRNSFPKCIIQRENDNIGSHLFLFQKSPMISRLVDGDEYFLNLFKILSRPQQASAGTTFSAGANWRPNFFFFSCQMEKCGRQKVSVKLFLCSKTQAKIIATGLPAKYLQSM